MQRNNQLTSPHQISPSLSLWCTIKSSVTVSLHCDSISLHTRDRFCPETVLRWLGPPSNVAVCETCSRLYYFVPSLLGLFLVVFHCFLAHHFQRTNNTCNSRFFFLTSTLFYCQCTSILQLEYLYCHWRNSNNAKTTENNDCKQLTNLGATVCLPETLKH